jgi:maltose alpha-D-glucosyltransferase/alpha-amylase
MSAEGPRIDHGAIPSAVAEAIGAYLTLAEALGRRTAELHLRLADASGNPVFEPEPYAPDDLRRDVAAMRARADAQMALLEQMLPRLDERRQTLARALLERRGELLRPFDEVGSVSGAGCRMRCHGDYHLGQVLVTEGDIVIIDFEGEPSRPIVERRAKGSPLRDVAGMLRSFSYAALTGLEVATLKRPDHMERLTPWAQWWEIWVGRIYLRAYVSTTGHAPFLPAKSADLDALLRVFVLEKALYELGYELNNRPEWVHVPLAGLLRLPVPGQSGAPLEA